MKIIVLGGAGDMGSRAVEDLAKKDEVAGLTIADKNIDEAKALAHKLGDRVKALQVDATNHQSLVNAIKGHQVVASALGPFYRFEKPAVKAALEARVDYVSICDDYDAVKGILPLDQQAKDLGVRVLTGMGWTPGISNMLALKGAQDLDQVEKIHIYWAGSSADATGLAVVLHTIHIFTGQVISYQGGQWVEIPAGTGKEEVEFLDPLGKMAMYHLGHPEPVTLPKYIPGVQDLTLKGGLREGHLNNLAILAARLGLSNSPGKKQGLGKVLKGLLPLLEKLSPPKAPMSGIRVDIQGTFQGQPQQLVYQAKGSMRDLTGVPLAIGALMLGRGHIDTLGVFPPEAAIDPDSFIEDLAQRGIEVVPTQPLKHL